MTYFSELRCFAENRVGEAGGTGIRRGMGALLAALITLGCGGGPVTQRYVDSPAGTGYELGAAKNTTYSAEIEPAKDVLRLIVFEQSECDKIRVRIVARTEQSVRDGEVIAEEPMGPVQIAEGNEGVVPCDQRFARDVRVSLQVGSATHLLGHTDPRGELAVNLSAGLEQSLYGENAPANAVLIVEGQAAGEVPLAELRKHEERMTQLIAEFQSLLDRPQTALSQEDIARAYVLFDQLSQLSRRDARVTGLQTRFLEMVYGRKQQEATENMKRNLEALSSAKELLSSATSTPMFVQVGLKDGTVSTALLTWAQGQILGGLRTSPAICQGGITWPALLGQSWPTTTQVAIQYLRYAYGDGYVTSIQQSCSTLGL